MANVIFTNILTLIAKGDVDLENAVLRVMLERSTSTYTPDKDHQDRADLSGFVEITVPSYSRQTIANGAVANDNANDRAEFDFDDVAFGALESGQTVKAFLIYVQTGGDDTTPADDWLVCYVDTDAGAQLPIALNGSAFTLQLNAEGLIHLAQS